MTIFENKDRSSEPCTLPDGRGSDFNRTNSKSNLLLHLENLDALKKAYLPFIKDCGLFVQTSAEFSLGSEVELSLNILDTIVFPQLQGKIVWINPPYASLSLPEGIGIQINSLHAANIKEKIEIYLETLCIK